jgi:hypothetical protein
LPDVAATDVETEDRVLVGVNVIRHFPPSQTLWQTRQKCFLLERFFGFISYL